MLSNREKKKPIATDLDKFDYSVHRCLGTKDTALIVAKIDAKQLNLYQLTNKVDRLCDIQQLGRNSKSGLRNSMVWYKEFVNTPRIEKASDQYESIRSKVRAYITTFIKCPTFYKCSTHSIFAEICPTFYDSWCRAPKAYFAWTCTNH